MNEDLAAKGQRIIEELGCDRQDVLSRWMAHYIAELMEAAESECLAETDTQTMPSLCADLILRLWETKVQEETNRIRSRLSHWFARAPGGIHLRWGNDDEDESHYEDVRKALAAAPESIRDQLGAEAGVVFWSLSDLEHCLIELLWISEVLNDPEADMSDDVSDDVVQELLKDAITEARRSRVSRVFPAFADLPLEDLDATRRQVAGALESIYQLRSAYLWQEEQ